MGMEPRGFFCRRLLMERDLFEYAGSEKFPRRGKRRVHLPLQGARARSSEIYVINCKRTDRFFYPVVPSKTRKTRSRA